MNLLLRAATLDDLSALVELETRCFEATRLGRQQFRWMMLEANACLMVAEGDGQSLLGYALVLFRQGSTLARLHSVATDPRARGNGIGQRLLDMAETSAREHDCAYLRLEVCPNDRDAVALFERNSYDQLELLSDFFPDHREALRMEKRVVRHPQALQRPVPYYHQTTEFTCGPACLLMAMGALDGAVPGDHQDELRLWREASSVHMPGGHGGCSPHGLALAAWRRGYQVRLHLSDKGPLFLDEVRNAGKREVIRQAHEDFCSALENTDVEQHLGEELDLRPVLDAGGQPLVLVDGHRRSRSRAPHWVLVTDCDRNFIYLHDPNAERSLHRRAQDCQHIPVTHREFERISRFGLGKQRAAVVLYPRGT
ncbi:GNAT family N-acetyltransferase/peptidase C39 family protein [Pseudomonas sp. BN411]|uniref:GNAT family N-acetyltransferase/peptidase C39 family protein n=1 Tax=Pseudomonas sp. BN411 TaxID=2567887 RepID=UPI00245843D0|nr:GNAT family N-acetyltransferase/peptidase C39 family protein [Pseudomonas sp. BN411]MDH4562806.1 GNAT family N-acetyltransferase [Pseudomonas sp. BN411]